jgi:hypothetical protein
MAPYGEAWEADALSRVLGCYWQAASSESRQEDGGDMSSLRHKHHFHALWWHYGKYGPQNVHLHPCSGEGGRDCDRVLIGAGRDCSGDGPHFRHTVRETGPKLPRELTRQGPKP